MQSAGGKHARTDVDPPSDDDDDYGGDDDDAYGCLERYSTGCVATLSLSRRRALDDGEVNGAHSQIGRQVPYRHPSVLVARSTTRLETGQGLGWQSQEGYDACNSCPRTVPYDTQWPEEQVSRVHGRCRDRRSSMFHGPPPCGGDTAESFV